MYTPPVHLVQFGVLGHIGRFSSADSASYPRHARVLCRTARGLEVGRVLSSATGNSTEGSLLRRMTPEDELLAERIERKQGDAFVACSDFLAQREITTPLLETEPLFDGRTVFFHFLGDVTPEIEELLPQLAEVYEAAVDLGQFAEMLTAGCGPGCGTEESENGCASGACATCAVACSVKRS